MDDEIICLTEPPQDVKVGLQGVFQKVIARQEGYRDSLHGFINASHAVKKVLSKLSNEPILASSLDDNILASRRKSSDTVLLIIGGNRFLPSSLSLRPNGTMDKRTTTGSRGGTILCSLISLALLIPGFYVNIILERFYMKCYTQNNIISLKGELPYKMH